jgi:orotate phosphoribosyltransferase
MTTDVDALLRSTGAILEGHFRLTSGRHSDVYIEKFRIMEHPEATATLCSMIADRYRDAGVRTVVGPAMGGVILSYETARHLGVRDIFAEKNKDGRLIFDRDFMLAPDEPVLVVDDVLTTGGSVQQVLDLVKQANGKVVGVGMLIDRTDGAVDFGVPFYACHVMKVESYAPDACPLCAKGMPLTET